MATLALEARITLYEDALDALASGASVAEVQIGSVRIRYSSSYEIQAILQGLYAQRVSTDGGGRNYVRFGIRS